MLRRKVAANLCLCSLFLDGLGLRADRWQVIDPLGHLGRPLAQLGQGVVVLGAGVGQTQQVGLALGQLGLKSVPALVDGVQLLVDGGRVLGIRLTLLQDGEARLDKVLILRLLTIQLLLEDLVMRKEEHEMDRNLELRFS